ncbi:hypothetical protein [Halogeometricum limi]|uniref:Uncharacterized protein n=1 Tax=Halogeometricum limi TaxID=555875 RepID=A0A1I6HUY3_9EURY|nr:hypothetical protein [Halogeometricum limi]SFR58272.1 hypothetical protein SAMN04488124_2492 [Halogeometricum limi]
MELYFANIDNTPAKCQHVRARSRDNLRKFLHIIYHVGEKVDYDRDRLIEEFEKYAGASTSAGEETNALLKKFGFLGSDNSPTDSGEFAGYVIKAKRSDLLDDILIQHMRGMPTIAYTLDILRSASQSLSAEEIHERMITISDTSSTSKENSVRNALHLIDDFKLLNVDQPGDEKKWKLITRDQAVPESIPYGVYLLGQNHQTLEAPYLRQRLPRLVNCSDEGTEQLLRQTRDRYSLFTYGTMGDSARTNPFGGVFDIQVGNIGPNDLQDTLL